MMNKLTADRCKQRITELQFKRDNQGMSNQMYDYLEALEIALPVLEQQERGEQVDILSAPEYVLNEKWNDHFGLNQQPIANPKTNEGEWIEWSGGERPVGDGMKTCLKFRDGDALSTEFPQNWEWEHENVGDDIIAYRIIPEQPTNQNGEQ